MWCRLADSYGRFEGILTGSSTLQNTWVGRTCTDKSDGVPSQCMCCAGDWQVGW